MNDRPINIDIHPESCSLHSNRVTCQYIKRDGLVCGKVSTRLTGCAKHWQLYEKNALKKYCKTCNKITASYTDYCPTHAKRIYTREWRERKKTSYE
jgi:hypothetical protein